MLTAALNDAKFRLNGSDIEIPGRQLLSSNFSDVPIVRGFAFEGVANRNSLGYLEEYGLPQDLPTILRGSECDHTQLRCSVNLTNSILHVTALRYPGFARIVNVFKQIGLLSLEPLHSAPSNWSQTLDLCLQKAGYTVKDDTNRLEAIANVAGLKSDDPLVAEVLTTLQESVS